MIAFGTAVLSNGAAHVIGSVLTRSYSPGAVSGLLLWLPLGVFTLRRAWHDTPRASFVAGVLAGVVLHALVLLSAFSSLRRSV